MPIKQKLMRCVNCNTKIKSNSAVRKYCFDCRVKMRDVWLANFKKKKKANAQRR